MYSTVPLSWTLASQLVYDYTYIKVDAANSLTIIVKMQTLQVCGVTIRISYLVSERFCHLTLND